MARHLIILTCAFCIGSSNSFAGRLECQILLGALEARSQANGNKLQPGDWVAVGPDAAWLSVNIEQEAFVRGLPLPNSFLAVGQLVATGLQIRPATLAAEHRAPIAILKFGNPPGHSKSIVDEHPFMRNIHEGLARFIGSERGIVALTKFLRDQRDGSLSGDRMVLFRAANGRLTQGRIDEDSFRRGDYRVQGPKRNMVTVSRDELFHYQNIPPGGLLYTKGELPAGVYRDFLNEMLHYTSRPEFKQLGAAEQVRTLALFVKNLLPWNESGKTAELFGVTTKSDTLCSGAAVCRHISNVLGDILRESGFEVRVQKFATEDQNNPRHQWLQVKVNEDWFYVDSSTLHDDIVFVKGKSRDGQRYLRNVMGMGR